MSAASLKYSTRNPEPSQPNAAVVSIEFGGHRSRVVARRNALVEQHLDLVRSIAERIKASLPPSFDLEDLISAGNVGLVNAATRYRPKAFGGTPFSAYARRVIRGAILDSINRRHYTENTRPGIDETNEPAAAPVIDISIDRERHLQRIRNAMQYLEPRKQAILSTYYGDTDVTFSEAGAAVGLARSHAAELHGQAISELRRILHVQ